MGKRTVVGLLIFEAPAAASGSKFLRLQILEFYNEAEQLQFSLQVWKRGALCPLSPCVNLGPNVFYKQRAAL